MDNDQHSSSYFQIRNSVRDPKLITAHSTIEEGQIQVYKRRWYVLVAFGLFSLTQNLVWNTWGPISTTAEEAFGWDDSTVATMANWGPISFVLSGLFFPWVLQVKGLRFSVVVSMALVAMGTMLRIVSVDPDKMTTLIHLGQFLNGLAGPIGMAAVSRISVTWFHPMERVTATAISTSLGTMGAALSFVLGPYFVSSKLPSRTFPQSIVIRDIPQDKHLTVVQLQNNATLRDAVLYRQKEQDVIWEYLFYEFLWSGVLMGAVLIHFPSAPPKPPGRSAVAVREEFWTGMRDIWRNRPFLTIAFSYAISIGVLSVWASVLNINLSTFGISQKTSGQIGFHSHWIGCAISLVVGRFADRSGVGMKWPVVLLYTAASVAFIVFLYALLSNALTSAVVICLTVIAGSTLLTASTPLMYELACEMVYPIAEATPNGIMAFLNNLAGIAFLGAFSFPHIGTMWMNWTLVVAVVTCIPLVMTLDVTYGRMDLEGKGHHRVKAI